MYISSLIFNFVIFIINFIIKLISTGKFTLLPRATEKQVVSRDKFSSDFDPQSDLEKIGQSATICWNLSEIHEKLDGNKIVIAILDTGINLKHNAFEVAYKDKRRIKVANFVGNESSEVQNVQNLTPGAHGTMAAYIAGGDAFKDSPCGIAPNSKLLICRIGEHSTGYSNTAVIKALEALKEVREGGEDELHIVSMSIGRTRNEHDEHQKKITNLIEDLQGMNVVCIAACGNYGKYQDVLFPACLDSVISVGALDDYGDKRKSNPQSGVDVFAPGENVPAPSIYKSDGVVYSSGSSCATPAIAGLTALVMQYANKHLPTSERNKFRDVHYLKNTVFGREMKGQNTDSHIIRPYEYFKNRLERTEHSQKTHNEEQDLVIPNQEIVTEQPKQQSQQDDQLEEQYCTVEHQDFSNPKKSKIIKLVKFAITLPFVTSLSMQLPTHLLSLRL